MLADRALKPAWMVSEPALIAFEPAGWVSKPAGRVSEPVVGAPKPAVGAPESAWRAMKPAEKTLESARIGSEPAERPFEANWEVQSHRGGPTVIVPYCAAALKKKIPLCSVTVGPRTLWSCYHLTE